MINTNKKEEKIANKVLTEVGIEDLKIWFALDSATFVPSNKWIRDKKCDKNQQVVGAMMFDNTKKSLEWLSKLTENPELVDKKDDFTGETKNGFLSSEKKKQLLKNRTDESCTAEWHKLLLESAPKAKKALELLEKEKTV